MKLSELNIDFTPKLYTKDYTKKVQGIMYRNDSRYYIPKQMNSFKMVLQHLQYIYNYENATVFFDYYGKDCILINSYLSSEHPRNNNAQCYSVYLRTNLEMIKPLLDYSEQLIITNKDGVRLDSGCRFEVNMKQYYRHQTIDELLSDLE